MRLLVALIVGAYCTILGLLALPAYLISDFWPLACLSCVLFHAWSFWTAFRFTFHRQLLVVFENTSGSVYLQKRSSVIDLHAQICSLFPNLATSTEVQVVGFRSGYGAVFPLWLALEFPSLLPDEVTSL